MRAIVWTLAVSAMLLGCNSSSEVRGTGSTGGPADGGSASSGAPGQHSLTIAIEGGGAGSVDSADPAFTCAAGCEEAFTAGTGVHLTATAAQGSTFDGWKGACSGKGACDVVLKADLQVTAVFLLLPPPPPSEVQILVAFTGAGSGRVVSTPAGIDCPGACSMTVSIGTAVSLAQQAAVNSVFVGWGSGCSGAGGCSLTATADVTVWANFAVSTCATIAPPTAVTMEQYVAYPSQAALCRSGLADASGALAFQMMFPHVSAIDFVNRSRPFGREQTFASTEPNLIEQPSGFAAVGNAGYLGPRNVIDLGRWDAAGNSFGDAWRQAQNQASAADPAGGVLVAGDLSADGSSAPQHQAVMFSGGGEAVSVTWAQPLAAAGPVFGAGVDVLGRSLVITGGASGSITAQWFDHDGTALTGEFTLIASFTPGQNTWFETAPLIGSGLEVRRMDALPLTAQALLVVQSGSTAAQDAPAWMTSRPNTRLQLARQGTAYAVLPYGESGVACTQTVELLGSDGTSCGSRDYPIASGTCDTYDLTLGADGTVIQQLPLSMETPIQKPTGNWNTCTWRFWSGALR